MTDHSEHMVVVDSAAENDRMTVYVRDQRDGQVFRINFRRNLHGQYKPNGGGGYKPKREEFFEAAGYVAKDFVQNTLNHQVVPKSDWNLVKPDTAARILEDSDEYEVNRVTGDDDE